MVNIEVPRIIFGEWRKWRTRFRPSQDMDVPTNFGILGLYLLAAHETEIAPDESPEERHLNERVVYIGLSAHVEQRLERTHHAVAKYREDFADTKWTNLWFTVWHSDWNNREHDTSRKTVALASIALYERALLLAYAKKHGRLPALNKV